MKLLNCLILSAMVMMATPVVASENKPANKNMIKEASSGSLFVASAGEVILTFLSKNASYSNDLFLVGSSDSILNNQTAISGQQFSLGSFQSGAELVFKMFVNNTGHTFFNGAAAINADNVLHTGYNKQINTVIVGFEDIYGGGDKDYNDLVFSLSNVGVGTFITAPVPEPETYAMLIAGLLMFGFAMLRKG